MTDDVNFEAFLVTRYIFEGSEIIDRQPLQVEKLSNEKLLMKESSGLLEDYKLFFGDEVIVRHLQGNECEVVDIVTPSAMRHYFWVTNGEPLQSISQYLLGVGGNWECDAGGLVTLHIPRNSVSEFEQRVGSLTGSEEWFGGLQEF